MTLAVLLRCKDLHETRTFYESMLGFTASAAAERTLTVEKGSAKLLFTEQDLWRGDPACTGTLYISVPDVDDFHARVRGLAPLAWELQDMPYGSREFGIRDCNGYLLAFHQQR